MIFPDYTTFKLDDDFYGQIDLMDSTIGEHNFENHENRLSIWIDNFSFWGDLLKTGVVIDHKRCVLEFNKIVYAYENLSLYTPDNKHILESSNRITAEYGQLKEVRSDLYYYILDGIIGYMPEPKGGATLEIWSEYKVKIKLA